MTYLMRYSVTLDSQGVANYERDVEQVLQTIQATKTGLAVFHKIVAHGVVRIKPMSAASIARWGRCNALAFGQEHEEKVTGGLHRRAVDVEFTPQTWIASGGCAGKGPGSTIDEILLHELVHAMRNLGRDSNQVPLTGRLKLYENEEEYFAILVANIYSSELGRQPTNWLVGSGTARSGLRADHGGFNNLNDDESIGVEFLMRPDNYALVKKFCKQHPQISQQIAQANGRFNPLKIFYRWKKLGIEAQNGHLVRVK